VETSRRLGRSRFRPPYRDRGGDWWWQQQEKRGYGHLDDTGNDCKTDHDNRCHNDGGPDDHRPGHCRTDDHSSDDACTDDASAYNAGPAAGNGCSCGADVTTHSATSHACNRTGRLLSHDEHRELLQGRPVLSVR
jgi:hypothetical protein